MKKILAATAAGIVIGVAGTYAIVDRGYLRVETQQQHAVRDLAGIPKMSQKNILHLDRDRKPIDI